MDRTPTLDSATVLRSRPGRVRPAPTSPRALGLILLLGGLATFPAGADDLPRPKRPTANTAQARANEFLASSRFRPVPTVSKSGSGEVALTADLRVEYRFTNDGPGDREDLRRQLQGLALAVRFARNPEERSRIRALARRFDLTWSGSTSPYLGDRRSALDDDLETLLSEWAPRVRIAARDALSSLIQQRRGDHRHRVRTTRGRLEEALIEERGILQDQLHRSLHQIGGTVRRLTDPFHASTFDELEGPHLRARRGCATDSPFDVYDTRLTRAQKAVGEIQGRTLYELLAAIAVPKESLEATRRRADERATEAYDAAVTELEEAERAYVDELSRKHADYLQDLDKVLRLPTSSSPTVNDLLTLRLRTERILTNASVALLKHLESHWAKPRRVVGNLERTYAAERRKVLTSFLAETRRFEDTVQQRVERAADEIEERVSVAQDDFRAFGAEHAFARAPNSSTRPFEALPSAAIHADLGLELSDDLRLSFARRWLTQRADDLDRQFRLIALLHRFSGDKRLGLLPVQQLVRSFNALWTRSEISRRDAQRMETRLRETMANAAPVLREAIRVGLESVILENRLPWRRAYRQEVANLRAAASRGSDEDRLSAPTEAVGVIPLVAEACAQLTELREESLGDLERAYYDLGGTDTDDDAVPVALTEAQTRLQEMFDAAIGEFRAGSVEQLAAARIASESAELDTRSQLADALEQLAAADREFAARVDRARTAAIDELEAIWNETPDRSVYQYDLLLESIRRIYGATERTLDSRVQRDDLEKLASTLRSRLTATDDANPKVEEFRDRMTSRRAELRVEARHIVRDAIRAMERRAEQAR